MVAFQRGASVNNHEQQLPIGKIASLNILDELQEFLHAPDAIASPLPRFAEDVDLHRFKPDPVVSTAANSKDLCWLFTRYSSTPDQLVPAWTGFNQLRVTNTEEVSSVGYLPIINAPAHKRDTLSTVLNCCMQISQELNPGQSGVVTFDEQLYSKAKELQWGNPEFCGKIFVRLGSFHIGYESYWAALHRFWASRSVG